MKTDGHKIDAYADATARLVWDSLDELINEKNRLIQRDAFGAYRAGYDFLHVYNDAPFIGTGYRVTLWTRPSNSPNPPHKVDGSDLVLKTSYDLRDVSPEEVRNARQK